MCDVRFPAARSGSKRERTMLQTFRTMLFTALLASPVWTTGPAAAEGPADLPGGACKGQELACAKSATPLLLPDGTLWLAWTAGGHVSVARSDDLGHSFGPAAVLDPVARTVDDGPDARPKIVRDSAGRLIVA